MRTSRIDQYRRQFIITRDRRVENLVNFDDYGFGVRVIVDGTWGFASSSIVSKEEIARVAGAGGRDRACQPRDQHRGRRARAGGSLQGILEHAGEEEPVRHARFSQSSISLLQVHEEALKVPGASFVTA